VAAYGGGSLGVKEHAEKVGNELRDAMLMTGCHQLADIDNSKASTMG